MYLISFAVVSNTIMDSADVGDDSQNSVTHFQIFSIFALVTEVSQQEVSD